MTEVVVYVLHTQSIQNAWLIHFYTPIECFLLLLVLSKWQLHRRTQLLYKTAMITYAIVYAILKLLSVESFEPDSINFVTRPLALLLISAAACYTLNNWALTKKQLGKQPEYWVLLAILSYYLGSVILVAFMYTKTPDLLLKLFDSHTFLNILHNILFTIGVLMFARQTSPK